VARVSRRLLTIGAAAVLTVVGSLAAGHALGSGGATSHPQESPVTTVERGPFRCPNPKLVDVPTTGSALLPAGAVAARLCVRGPHAMWVAPRDVLTGGVDSLVTVVNAQKVWTPSDGSACAGVGAPTYSIVFRYADGIRTISGDNGGCWDLNVGSTRRVGSKSVSYGFATRLTRQRRGSTAPDVKAPALSCRHRTALTTSLVWDSRVVTGARACGQGFKRTGAAAGTPLTAVQLALLRRELRTSEGRIAPPSEGRHCQASPSVWLVMADAWSDRTNLLPWCGHYYLIRATTDRTAWIRELPATRRLFARLAAATSR